MGNRNRYLTILILSLNLLCGFGQGIPLKDYFPILLKNNNLVFNLPDCFFVPDTIVMETIPLLNSAPIYLIKSFDNNIIVYFVYLKYSKSDEDFYKKLNSGHDINLTLDYLKMLKNISSKHSTAQSFNEKDIKYFNKKEIDSIGTDIGGEYSMTLASPFQKKYTHLTIRFIGKYYNFWWYSYFFFKEYEPNFGEELTRQTKYMLIIK